MSEEEYLAMREELSAKKSRMYALKSEIERLDSEIIAHEFAQSGAPLVPGMYFHPEEGWPAVLGEDGVWSDGWGNPFEEQDTYDFAGLKRVEFVPDPEEF